ncbi:putative neural-cadherin 2 [Panulirus ornatus]|uniref:putative neural-cadherin 2 n=1 Tax=Panulirus ornatus TaxID=150431 RepID=UPI003A8A450C
MTLSKLTSTPLELHISRYSTFPHIFFKSSTRGKCVRLQQEGSLFFPASQVKLVDSMDPGQIFHIITNSTLLATRLLSGSGVGPLEFSESRYCAVLPEDAQIATTVLAVNATHKHSQAVRYSITGGNKDGLFTIDQHSGVITLAAALDYEIQDKHELVVAAEGGGHTVHAMVQVRVNDVNDNPPYFLNPQPHLTVVEEDDRHLPATIAKVEAQDADRLDHHGLLYTVRGDGVDGYDPSDAFFTINSLTGELIQRRAVDRDPPRGKGVWRVRVQVRDGQALWSRQAMDRHLARNSRTLDKTRERRGNRSRNRNGTFQSGKIMSQKVKGISFSSLEDVTPRENGSKNTKIRKIKPDNISKSMRERVRDKHFVFFKKEISRHIESGAQTTTVQTTKSKEESPSQEHSYKYLMLGQTSAIPRLKTSKADGSSKLSGRSLSANQELGFGQQEYRNNDEKRSRKTNKLDFKGSGEIIPQEMIFNPRIHENMENVEYRCKACDKDKMESGVVEAKYVTPHTRRSRGITEYGSKVIHTEQYDRNLLSPRQIMTELDSRSALFSHAMHKTFSYSENLLSSNTRVIPKASPQSSERRSGNTVPSASEEKDKALDVIGSTDRDAIVPRKQTSSPHTNDSEPTLRPHITKTIRTRDCFAKSGTIYRDKSGINIKESLSLSAVPEGHLVRSRVWRAAESAADEHYELGSFSSDSGCDDGEEGASGNNRSEPAGRRLDGGSLHGLGGSRVHVSETVVTLLVKDINDNPPVFPNATMFGHVQENGPIDLSVAVISAWDADDTSEGTNARITYSIEKNVIQERTGEAIFSVHPDTGVVRTAICCLDRETTPEYEIQVVATDGGGLRGTGVVVVRLVDVNDNPPRLERTLWHVEMDETWGAGPPDNSTLLHISVLDPDTANYFFYRVVEASGWGWEHFGMRTAGYVGQLYALKTLDYEDDTHRRGFKFMVQVTDRGRGGWEDSRHLDSAWVSVLLRDVNDNPPQFHRPHAHVTVREDAAPGTLLAALPAHDPDMGGQQKVDYRVEGGWGALTVDSEGEVSLRGVLDREAPPDGAIGVAKILGVDRGQPPLTATATLTITVTDVNDSPPVLLPPTLFHVTEGAAPTRLGALTATDHDVWALGHGPPFNLSLAPSNPTHVFAYIRLKFDPHLDSGRGGAELWTVDAVDREEHRQLLVGVLVADAGGLAATHTVTVVIDDVNDNPMKPAAKTVYLWKTQGGGSDAPLGRVFVDDPDDWDLGDKTFRWRGSPHPLFSLNTHTGDIFASSQVREGRYELQFAVDDLVWGQRDVAANVTVAVRVLPPDALAHAAPITLTPTTPAHLTTGWTPEKGGGSLGRLLEAVLRVVGEATHRVEVVSVHTHQEQMYHSNTRLTGTPTRSHPLFTHASSARVWVSVREAPRGSFMDPVKLQGLLALHSHQLGEATNLTVVMAAPATGPGGTRTRGPHNDPALPSLHHTGPPDPSSAASRASLPLQVVDTNSTSLVTPRLTSVYSCHAHEPETCVPISCLNGGRCLDSSDGNRCVCPGGSWGARCKVLARTFSGDGWAWVKPLPPCLPTTISLRLLTRRPHTLILYSGPLAPLPPHPHSPPTPMLALQLWRGRPQLLLEGSAGALKLEVNATVNDGDWHTIHLRITSQRVALMVDLCGRGWDNTTLDDSHCAARGSWTDPRGVKAWAGSGPLQVGGLAHTPPSPSHHGWQEAPTPRPLDGCVSHLTLNGQLVDLGEPAYSRGSEGGCRPQNAACPGGCGLRGQCVGGLRHPECECESGWAGPGCTTPTVPATFGSSSYMKLTLSFTPGPQVVRAHLRLRTRGARHGLLLHLASHQRAPAFTIYLRGGVACASLSGSGRAAREACVEGRPVGDGAWHTVTAERHGHNLVISVDDGDGWRRNESLVTPDEEGGPTESPTPFDGNEAMTLGGLPEFIGISLVNVLDDLRDSCIDDVRVSGRPMPLPPAVNGTSWGQVTTLQGLEPGCSAPDSCLNTTCAAPLSCVSTWGRASCSCGSGSQLVGRACQDVDECLWRPCLHGGSCYNLRPGFQCVCGPGHTGQHCQWTDLATKGHPLAAPVAIAALTVSLLLLVVAGVVVSLRLRRRWFTQGLAGRQADQEVAVVEGKVKAEEEGGTEDGGRSCLRGDEDHKTFIECLKLAPPHSHSSLQGIEKRIRESEGNLCTRGALASAIVQVGSGVSEGRDTTAPALKAKVAVKTDPQPAKDDLRAYAYEGEGSSAGSLTSALAGLREEASEKENLKSLVPEFLEVMDLLRNLPEATKSPSLTSKPRAEAVQNVEEFLTSTTREQSGSPHCTRGRITP